MTTEPDERTNHFYGWVPDSPNSEITSSRHRPPFSAPSRRRPTSPPNVRPSTIRANSATANAIAGALGFDADKQGIAVYTTPSRLFLRHPEIKTSVKG